MNTDLATFLLAAFWGYAGYSLGKEALKNEIKTLRKQNFDLRQLLRQEVRELL